MNSDTFPFRGNVRRRNGAKKLNLYIYAITQIFTWRQY